ncbi:MAG: carboxy terminal-processing peptidase [Candidatus Margulisiibacteriota bacterium]|jgi:carboxyl-terminal processing protease
MNIISYLFLKILVLVIFIFPLYASNNEFKQQALENIIFTTVEKSHYNPKKIDSEFSQNFFEEFIKKLDPNKEFFLAADIEKLKEFKYKIDDEFKNNSLEFFNVSCALLKVRINTVQEFYADILKRPFNYYQNDTIQTNSDKLAYCVNEKELKNRWYKKLKFKSLTNYLHLLEVKKKLSFKKIDKNLEKEARSKTFKNTKLYLSRLINNQQDLFYMYLNLFATLFDPHTAYLPPQEKEDFEISMTGKLEGIGAVLTEEDDYIKVVEIIPGSPAEKEGELAAEDKILKVAEGNKEPVDLVAMKVQDAVKLIRGKKGTEVCLTVKKPTGRIVVIPIIRDIVTIEETYIKYCLTNDKVSRKFFGYIQIPRFYRDFNSFYGRNVTEDLDKAVKALNKYAINGLIIDIRNNGGGSLSDAIQTAGLFIKTGPILQVKGFNEKSEVLEDLDPAEVYHGPIVVLVNKFSASASEIFSAALQDYNRAIIVGTDSTYGKGSVQNVIDLDRLIKDKYNYLKPLGSLKLTVQLFYRINGNIIQTKGVIPDIILEDQYSFLDISEKKSKFFLPSEKIDAVQYEESRDVSYNMNFLVSKSETRRKDSEYFNYLDVYLQKMKQKKDKTLVSLNYFKAKDNQIGLIRESNKLKKFETVSLFGFDNIENKETKTYLKWLKGLTKDPYLKEAVYILDDVSI